MIGVLRIFLGSDSASRWTVLLCLLVAGIAEGVGLAALLPLLSLATPEAARESSALNRVVIDTLDDLGLAPTLATLVVIVVSGLFLKSALVILAMRYVGNAMAEVATRLRKRLIDNLLAAKWEYFTHQPVGRIANAVSLEATRSGEAYLLAALVVANIVQCFVYVAVAFLVSWKQALVSVAVGGMIALSLSWLVTASKKAGRRQTKRTRELTTGLSDALAGIKVLKAMSRQGHFADIFDNKIAALKRALRKQVVSNQALRNLREPMLAMCLAVGFYFAVEHWVLPIADLFVMSLLLYGTVSTIGKMQQQYQKAVIVESAYWSIHGLIEESERQAEPLSPGIVPALEHGCVFENLSYSFASGHVIENLSLEIPANKLTVIMGASGVGKTTLIDHLLGLYRPKGGRILIDGVPLERIDLAAWRAMVGYVPQEMVLFHDTILANVTLGDQSISADAARAALEAAGAWPFVAKAENGILSQVGERGSRLSGGQRQRIALARALAHGPKLLILDEVTSALDPETEMAVCRNVRALSGSLTIVAITHTPAWTSVADRLYTLDADGASEVDDGARHRA